MAGFSQGGGVGLALAQWMIHGECDSDVFAMDVARFGDFATRTYTHERVREFYSSRVRIAFSNELWPAGRPAKTSPLHADLESRHAAFGVSYGLEIPMYIARDRDSAMESPTFYRSNAWQSVAAECRAVREAAGVIDATSYSRYLISGPRAREWLDRLLASRLPSEGRVRLAPMLSAGGRLAGDLEIIAFKSAGVSIVRLFRPVLVAGLAVALEAGVDIDAAIAALEALEPGNKRGEILEIAGATLLNDSYNSNPEALRSMIHTLATRPAKRRILVAGEMLELGEQGQAFHAACGKAAAEAGLDLVVGVRGNAQHLAAAACWGGVASIFLPDAEAAGDWLSKNLRKGDVVLVKGSRGVQLERAIEVLKTNSQSKKGN